jgi:hypothetical protein
VALANSGIEFSTTPGMKIYFLPAMIVAFVACNNNTSSTLETTSDTNVVAECTDTSTMAAKDSILNNNEPAAVTESQGSNNLIVPGTSIGKALIGANADSLELLFGKPDLSDAAMGKAWLTWYGKKRDEHNNKTQLDIYTAYKDTSMREKTVQQIRTTSSYFKTENGVHVYSALAEIKHAFPGITQMKQNVGDAKKFTVYDDVKKGIAFEVVDVNGQQICRAIFIHQKSKKVADIYIGAPGM